VSVLDNTIVALGPATYEYGIYLLAYADGPTATMSNIQIGGSGNQLENNATYGVLVYGYGTGATVNSVNVEGNDILNNNTGIRVTEAASGTSTNINVNCNNIYSNTTGAQNTAAAQLNAENNWWGSASGPFHPTLNPGGTGNAVSDNVDFTPWSATPGGITLTANPGSILANGSSTSTITATVNDMCGTPVTDGTVVTWSTTIGTINPSSTTTGGIATTTLTSSTTPGTATVTATTTIGGIVVSGSVNVVFLSPPKANPAYIKNMLSAAQNHISEAKDLITQTQDLLSQAKAKGKDTSTCEKLISEAQDLLSEAKSVLTNPIYANNLAMEAIKKLKQAIDCLKALLG